MTDAECTKASLVQREVSAEQADGGIEKQYIYNPSVKNRFRSADFCQLPLHRGAVFAAFCQISEMTGRIMGLRLVVL